MTESHFEEERKHLIHNKRMLWDGIARPRSCVRELTYTVKHNDGRLLVIRVVLYHSSRFLLVGINVALSRKSYVNLPRVPRFIICIQ